MKPAAQKAYYPLFADLTGRRCIIIGGGMVAQRKAKTLLRYGALVTVISPTLTRALAALVKRRTIAHVARRFRPSDLRGAWLVYAATNDQHINQLVYRTANRQRIFTNVVDQKALCSFIAPAIVKRGDLVIAVSTGGSSPTVAKRLRRELERTIGTDYAQLLRLLEGLRPIAKRRMPSYADRKRYFSRLVAGRVFQLVRAGKTRQARREALALLARSATNGR